jgi:predicted DsbA family dithiol-disulfide isomerase
MDIAVFSDVICPWCFIGKRRLERALDQAGLAGQVAIEWLPFELNPDMPPEGMARSEYRARKFGAERAAMLDAQIGEVGSEEGIRFAFDRMARTPNTRRAHMLIARATQQRLGEEVVEALFTAYFERGLDIGDEEALVEIASGAGLDADEIRSAVRDEELRRMVIAAERQAQELGISGVPFFVVDRAFALSGAQPTPAWLEALEQVKSRSEPAAARAG